MRRILILSILLITGFISTSQSPGLIVRPANGSGVTILNPNGDAYSSSTTAGFTTNDITQSEVPYFVVPPAITEPTGDIATGPSGGFTDIVKTADNSGFYVYYDGTNILFRLRIGNIISGSKGYSVLFDTDGKMGNIAPNADPNFIASTNTSNGNPGFEYEAVLQTNFQVAVYNVDGTSNPGSPIATYSLSDHSQISTALTTDGNNPDYFYDWYIPISAIGSPSSFRLSATTVTSPSSALQGSRSDIYGINDANSSVSSGWTNVINTQPTITLTSIGNGGAGVSVSCTAAPALTGPINTGSNISVSGTWASLDASKPSSATITLYKNGVSAGTTTVSTGNTWTITVASVSPNDVFYAKAQASGESQCLQSNNIIAGCSSAPASPTVACASSKGITGNIPLGATINIYQVSTANNSPLSVPLTTGLVYTTNATDQTFNYYGTNPQSGNACQGQNSLLPVNTTYMLVSNVNGCLSVPTFICITGASQNAWNLITSNSIAVTTPLYPYQSTISGTGAITGQLLRLFINNQYISAITASSSSFTFTGVTMNAGDVVKIYAQASGGCMSVSSSFTVSCYTQPPVITTNTSGNLLSTATSINGTSNYQGATVNLYKGISPSGTIAGTATVNSSGAWSVTGLTLTAGDTYYTTQTSGGCVSPSSSSASVTGTTTVCPTFGSSSYADNVSTVGGAMSSFTGTVRLYLDGTLVGSSAVTAATAWSIAVNINYSNTLYPGGVLTVTAQSSGNSESVCGSSATVSCSSPAQPSVSPLSSTINQGQTVTFNVSNVANNAWYAVQDNSGASYATSIYTSNTSAFNFTTNPFANAGTYSLNISADKLTGCAKSYLTATVVVNSNLPVTFINVSAAIQNNRTVINWIVDNEQNIDHYEVEESNDGRLFSLAGSVNYHQATGKNNYQLILNRLPQTFPAHFRVRQVDIDGQSHYSRQVIISNDIESKLKVFPDPVIGPVNISMQMDQAEKVIVRVVSVLGKTLFTKVADLQKGNNVFQIPALHSPGVYQVVIVTKASVYTSKCVSMQ